MPSPTALTPSEIVLVHGDRFAEKKSALASFVGAATLLDGASRVSRRQLVTNMIKAALLAHEQEHGIHFKIEDAGKLGAGGLEKSVVHSSRLAVTPTGTPADWPRATLESRLALNERARVADIVFNWLGEDSSDPWRRAVEQGMIMLVLRGVASVRTSRPRRRTYLFADDGRALPSQASPQAVEDLLARCCRERPDLWKLLDAEIKEAIRRRTRRSENQPDSAADSGETVTVVTTGGGSVPEVDPWKSEAQTDRERFLGQPRGPHVVRAKGRTGVVLALVGVALALLDGWIAGKEDLVAFAVVVAGFLTLVGGLLIVQPKAVRGFERWLGPPESESLTSLGESLIGLVFLVPLLTLFALVAGLFVARPMRPIFLWPGTAAAIVFLVYHLLQGLVAERIDERVKSGGGRAALAASAPPLSAPPSAPHAPTTTAAEPMSDASPAALTGTPEATGPTQRAARDLEASSGDGDAQVQLEIITADAIPPASAASQSRVAATRMRAPAIRRIYRKGVAWLAISTTLLALAYRLAGPAPLTFPNGWVQFSERIPWFVAGLLVVTLVLLSRRAQPWLRGVMKATVQIAVMAAIFGARVEANVSRQEVDESEASIRPFALRLLAAFWVAVALIRAATVYPSLAAPWPLIFNTIAVASVFGCLVWIRRGAAAVERQYPYQPPLNLLALRVFNSASLPDFLNLSHRWQWIGTRQLLDGPDSAGHKARDLLNYLEGRIARSIVKDEAELRRALGAFSTRPDRHLRFPVNSMQCGDATWKEAQLFEPGAMRAHGARGKMFCRGRIGAFPLSRG